MVIMVYVSTHIFRSPFSSWGTRSSLLLLHFLRHVLFFLPLTVTKVTLCAVVTTPNADITCVDRALGARSTIQVLAIGNITLATRVRTESTLLASASAFSIKNRAIQLAPVGIIPTTIVLAPANAVVVVAANSTSDGSAAPTIGQVATAWARVPVVAAAGKIATTIEPFAIIPFARVLVAVAAAVPIA
jgi:hypothetical protein